VRRSRSAPAGRSNDGLLNLRRPRRFEQSDPDSFAFLRSAGGPRRPARDFAAGARNCSGSSAVDAGHTTGSLFRYDGTATCRWAVDSATCCADRRS